MKKITIMIILTLVLALTSTMALAWGPDFGGFGVGPMFGFLEPAIPNLTAEQSDQIQALRDPFLKEAELLRNEFLEKRADLRSLERTPNSDVAVIKARLRDLFDLRAKLEEDANNYRLEVEKVLRTTSEGSSGLFALPGDNLPLGRMGN